MSKNKTKILLVDNFIFFLMKLKHKLPLWKIFEKKHKISVTSKQLKKKQTS